MTAPPLSTFTFPKRSVSAARDHSQFSDSPYQTHDARSDSEAGWSDRDRDHAANPAKSLLSAMLRPTSPDLSPSPSSQGVSPPSTAIHSPVSHHVPGHPYLSAMSILRRGSMSSDAGESAALPLPLPLDKSLGPHAKDTEIVAWETETQVQTQAGPMKRHCSLKFAMAPSKAIKPLETIVPLDRAGMVDDDPETPFTGDDEDEDNNSGGSGSDGSDADSASDTGYQEDSEESDDDEPRGRSGPKFPFARPTHFRLRKAARIARSASPPPAAPAVLPPPPSRRGRGHIRVADTASGKEGGCSRHRSPPPSASRPSSREGVHHGRLSDAGPRQGRAGSPMPAHITEDEDEEDEVDESPPKSTLTSGWRSDDAVFYGARSQVRPPSTTTESTPFADDIEGEENYLGVSLGHGVRNFFRRASEHLAFGRPTFPPVAGAGAGAASAQLDTASSTFSSAAASPAPLASQAVCPPAVDFTPILAQAVARDLTPSGGLHHRLEQTLASQSMAHQPSQQSQRSVSASSHSTAPQPILHFAPPPSAPSAPMPCPARVASRG